ncbi:hypothetical protein Hanom_Chr03g00193721 [Helianthus anomalus]
MTVKDFPYDELPWLDQIRDFFYHPTKESLASFSSVVTALQVCIRPLLSNQTLL